MPGGLLDGIRVVELGSGVSSAYGTKLLADFGAEVIKVEPPAVGDKTRRFGPFVEDDVHSEKSIPFLYLNTNKRGITLDIGSTTGRALLTSLLQGVDALVHNLPPAEAESQGLRYNDLAGLNSGLVVTSITPFGQTGPYRDFAAEDIVTCALSGLMYHSGDSDREPLRNALDQSFYVAGANAAAATLAALFSRLRSGQGQDVDVSVVECLATHLVQPVPNYTYMGTIKGRSPVRGSGLEELMPARDGYVVPSAQGSQPFSVVADLIGLEGLQHDRFSTGSGRIEHGEDLKQLLLEGLANWDRKPLFQGSGERRLVFGMAQDAGDLFECPQLTAREFFVEVNHPVAGKAKYAGLAPKLSESEFQVGRPAPLLGQHNVEIYCQRLGYSSQELVSLRATGVI